MTTKILIADDDDSLRTFVAKVLEKEGYLVVQAVDGTDAWVKLQNDTYDLLLTDIVMPNMDGVELSTRAIVDNPNMKVMFMTGFTGMAGDLEEKTTVVAKPFHLKDIVLKVNNDTQGVTGSIPVSPTIFLNIIKALQKPA